MMTNLTKLGISAVLLMMPVYAGAQTNNCGNHDTVVARLAERFGETRQSMGLGTNNSVVEVFASKETGSWTITVTSARGITCLVASGQAFETLKGDVSQLDSDV